MIRNELVLRKTNQPTNQPTNHTLLYRNICDRRNFFDANQSTGV